MKNQIGIIAVVCAIFFAVLTFVFQQKAEKLQQEVNQERLTRMNTEEKLEEIKTKIRSKETELIAAQDKIQAIQAALNQGQNFNSDLKSQLESVNKLKNTLETKVKALEEEQKNILEQALPPPTVPTTTPSGGSP